jgi:hypothetical protein
VRGYEAKASVLVDAIKNLDYHFSMTMATRKPPRSKKTVSAIKVIIFERVCHDASTCKNKWNQILEIRNCFYTVEVLR